MTTAADIITGALRQFGIVDITESPTPADIANGVTVLNDLLRQEQADGACQYLMRNVEAVLPAATVPQVYTFSIGTADSAYLVQEDAVAMRQMWVHDVSLTVNRETRNGPKTDVVRTTYPGIVTKWHTERQADGSVLVYAWQPPRADTPVLLEIGGRCPLLSAPDGSDVVPMPPEGVHDAKLLFGRRVCGSYGRNIAQADPVLAADAERVNARWRTWARGQQWLRLVRN